ncbi:glycosyltransferase family 1 protein [Candidatus Parcubacteria bacterium]|nr:MAG: glycosyltransferase family 1 protein [Candidatus Parcubacteria bacterium]
MNIALDITPIAKDSSSQHKVRGSGFYIQNLKNALVEYFPDNNYIFFTKGEDVKKNIGIIHYPYFETFFLTLPLIKSKKSVVTVHDLIPLIFPKNFPSGLKGRLKWEIQKRSLEGIDAIITDSYSSKNDIVKYTGIKEEKINVVYLAAGEEFKKCQVSRQMRGSPKASSIKYQVLKGKYKLPEQFILYVGDATWNKNLIRLIEAAALAQVPLVMVGKALREENIDKNNPWNKDLIRIQEVLKNNSHILRLGFVPTEDLVDIYNLATLFIMPSLYEGFGLPALEAMNCGCPVVLSREGSLPEVGGDAAYYIDAYSTEDIARGIEKIYSSKDIQKKLSDQSLIQAKKFSWKKTAEETINVYKKVLGNAD